MADHSKEFYRFYGCLSQRYQISGRSGLLLQTPLDGRDGIGGMGPLCWVYLEWSVEEFIGGYVSSSSPLSAMI